MDELEHAYWFSTHRAQLSRIAYGIGIVLCVFIWLNVGRYIITIVVNSAATQRAYTTIGDTTVLFNAQERAKPITIVSSGIVADGETTDAYALIHNPNRLFGATFSYSIQVSGQEYVFADGAIMPQQDAYLVIQGLNDVAIGTDVTFVLSQVSWIPLNGTPPRVEFTVTDAVLKPVEVKTITNINKSTDKTGASDLNTNGYVAPNTINTNTTDVPDTTTLPITNFTATVLNTSAYGFRVAQAMIILQDESGTVFGAKKLTLRDFQSNSSQPLQIYWSRRFPINVTPVVSIVTNYLSDDNLILPGE